ncbi:MAG: sporulation initiation factor Spo0A C-terminal domain-containing protein [bacterium]|nr:sporulation initiation factor Spo0A C-terminal domain-containing protein [bacterium]
MKKISRQAIENVLIQMGVPANISGFQFICEALEILDEDGCENVKYTYLYAKIAKNHHSNPSRVERAMRHAFEIARDCRSGDYELIDHYIGFVNCSNSASLKQLYLRIMQKQQASAATPIAATETSEVSNPFSCVSPLLIKQYIREVLLELAGEMSAC